MSDEQEVQKAKYDRDLYGAGYLEELPDGHLRRLDPTKVRTLTPSVLVNPDNVGRHPSHGPALPAGDVPKWVEVTGKKQPTLKTKASKSDPSDPSA